MPIRKARLVENLQSKEHSGIASQEDVNAIKSPRSSATNQSHVIFPVDASPPKHTLPSNNAMNKVPNGKSPDHVILSKISNGTIRSVPNESLLIEPASPQNLSPDIPDKDKLLPDMPRSNLRESKSSSIQQQIQPRSPISRQGSPAITQDIVRKMSAEFGGLQPSHSTGQLLDEKNTSGDGSPQWSSAVGRATVGKSGRVIERLMAENDMLKRELQITKLRADETKQAVTMAESRVDALSSEHESILYDASIVKHSLKRRERQVDELKGQIDGAKQRADTAVESERGWKRAMDEMEKGTKVKVEEAQTFAALMEGRNKVMASHWKDRDSEVTQAVAKLEKDIGAVVLERKSDDEKISLLQALSDQQAEQIRSLEEEKKRISKSFKLYKEEQDNFTSSIKELAQLNEKRNEALLEETQRALDELRWALAVKKNVSGSG